MEGKELSGPNFWKREGSGDGIGGFQGCLHGSGMRLVWLECLEGTWEVKHNGGRENYYCFPKRKSHVFRNILKHNIMFLIKQEMPIISYGSILKSAIAARLE